MSRIGAYIAIAGIASIVMNFFEYNLQILMWIDTWSEGVGWAIRIGLLVVGGAIFFIGKAREG